MFRVFEFVLVYFYSWVFLDGVGFWFLFFSFCLLFGWLVDLWVVQMIRVVVVLDYSACF